MHIKKVRCQKMMLFFLHIDADKVNSISCFIWTLPLDVLIFVVVIDAIDILVARVQA